MLFYPQTTYNINTNKQCQTINTGGLLRENKQLRGPYLSLLLHSNERLTRAVLVLMMKYIIYTLLLQAVRYFYLPFIYAIHRTFHTSCNCLLCTIFISRHPVVIGVKPNKSFMKICSVDA